MTTFLTIVFVLLVLVALGGNKSSSSTKRDQFRTPKSNRIFNQKKSSLQTEYFYQQSNLSTSRSIPETANIVESEDERYIRSFIAKNRIHCIYHFTARNNISSIKRRGGLFSWKYCKDNGIIYSGGGNELSRDLDRRKGYENYVRCSFCQDHPMKYRLECEGVETVLLEIDPIVLLQQGVLFSDKNAVDNGAYVAMGREGLEHIDFDATQQKYVSRDDPAFKPHQAEVLIPESIDLQYIKNIDKV